MIKAVLKLAIVGLIANATWHLFLAYSAHYKFKDSIEQASVSGAEQSEDQLREKVLTFATEFDVPLDAESFTVSKDEKRTIIDGAYKRPIDLAPGFSYPWSFTWHVDTYNVRPPSFGSSP